MAIQQQQQRVELIPWDPSDDSHVERMRLQRVACGWREEEVPLWKEKMLNSQLTLYWVILSEELENRESLLKAHVEQFPSEKECLYDTGTIEGKSSRSPSKKNFIPIGHTALAFSPDENKRLSLPEDAIWVKSLYISWALQKGGFGRSVMAQSEALATSSPYNTSVIALDTMRRDWQLSENHMAWMYDRRGFKRPETFRPNQDWYMGQGYQIVPTQGTEYYENQDDDTSFKIPIVYLKKVVG